MASDTHRRLARWLVLGVLLSFAFSCASTGESMPSATSTETTSGRRYAVQWISYLGAAPHESLYLTLAFTDFHGEAEWSAPIMADVRLETSRGLLPARVDQTTPSTPGSGYAFFTVALEMEPFPIGMTEVTHVLYEDEAGRERSLSVGQWIIDVRELEEAGLEEVGGTFAATSFGGMEVDIRNVDSRDYIVEGVSFTLPGLRVETQLFARSGPAPSAPGAEPATGEPSAVPPAAAAPVQSMDLSPGEEKTLIVFFTPQGDPRNLFVQLKPFLRYRLDGDGDERLLSLPAQFYGPSFDSDQAMQEYFTGLPPDASHELPARVPSD